MANRPTLLNSCASAATAAEARFRIDAPPMAPPVTRVVALDAGASAVARILAAQTWRGARFLTYEVGTAPGPPDDSARTDNVLADVVLADIVLASDDGSAVRLSEELIGTDFIMMIATADDGAAAASAIGTACALRGIMTAAVVVGDGRAAGAAVNALRPYARVLLVTTDQLDVAEIMAAVGA
jgi:hypothetical protein